MYKKRPQREQRVICPKECFKCKTQRSCVVHLEITILKEKLNKATTSEEKKRIQDILDILTKYDTVEDLHGSKEKRRK